MSRLFPGVTRTPRFQLELLCRHVSKHSSSPGPFPSGPRRLQSADRPVGTLPSSTSDVRIAGPDPRKLAYQIGQHGLVGAPSPDGLAGRDPCASRAGGWRGGAGTATSVASAPRESFAPPGATGTEAPRGSKQLWGLRTPSGVPTDRANPHGSLAHNRLRPFWPRAARPTDDALFTAESATQPTTRFSQRSRRHNRRDFHSGVGGTIVHCRRSGRGPWTRGPGHGSAGAGGPAPVPVNHPTGRSGLAPIVVSRTVVDSEWS
jgi:hypothetical protein